MSAVLETSGRGRGLVGDRLEVHDLELRVPDVAVAVEDLATLAPLTLRRQRDVQQLPAINDVTALSYLASLFGVTASLGDSHCSHTFTVVPFKASQ